ncbi:MAG: SCO family protein [Pirellulales bacterium]|nr:SCO family protein [Pirellulales bacterium]
MSSSSYKFFLGLLICAGLGLGAYVAYGYYANEKRPTAKPSTPVIADFTLTDRFGSEFHASDLKGEVWVASFFFTECAGACINLNSTIADLIQEDFPNDPVKFVSISVDPKKDDLATLDRYARTSYVEARGIDPQRWIFLTEPEGREYKIEEIATGYFKVPFGKITHSDRLMIVDRQGVVRAAISSSWDREVLRFKTELRKVLDEEPSAESITSDAMDNGQQKND